MWNPRTSTPSKPLVFIRSDLLEVHAVIYAAYRSSCECECVFEGSSMQKTWQQESQLSGQRRTGSRQSWPDRWGSTQRDALPYIQTLVELEIHDVHCYMSLSIRLLRPCRLKLQNGSDFSDDRRVIKYGIIDSKHGASIRTKYMQVGLKRCSMQQLQATKV